MKCLSSLIVSLMLAISLCAQHIGQGYLTDQFGKLTNDDLLARVEYFNNLLDKKKDFQGVVVMYGPSMQKHLMKRRIEGCNLILRQPIDRYGFVFAPTDGDVETKFYAIPLTEPLKQQALNYVLTDLRKPIELNEAFSTGDFCPLHFDLDWFSRFLIANPLFKGKAVIDISPKEFVRRVIGYRKQLHGFGIDPRRVRFLRKRFAHERDEQWWLIPVKKK